MKTILIFLMLMLTILSCSTSKTIPKILETNRTERDSISSTLSVRDTVIVVQQADTARLSQLINNLSEIPLQAKSNQATVTLRKVGNQIEAECVCDELKKAVEIYKETIDRYKTITERQEQTITELKTQMPAWAKPFLYLGIGVVVLMAVFASLYLYRIFKPI